MIKTCSLNYINKEYFDTDIMTKDGRVLFSANEKITPEIILRLYFKEIYIKDKPVVVQTKEIEKEQLERREELKEQTKELSVKAGISAAVSATEKELGIKASTNPYEDDEPEDKKGLKMPRMTIGSAPLQQPEEKQEEKPEDPIMQFSEEKAKKVASYSVKLGKMFGFSQGELKTLEQAAYNHDIGISRFKQSDSHKKGFRKKLAEVSYDILLNEMNMPTIVAETAKFCVINYEPKDFSLQEKIPFHHIVAVTSYYEEVLSNVNSKEKALGKMLQLGGNKFNTFVLHKFITIMKDADE